MDVRYRPSQLSSNALEKSTEDGPSQFWNEETAAWGDTPSGFDANGHSTPRYQQNMFQFRIKED